ncbi:MAG: acyl-CoA thioesterase [Alphaproteobacteria bacterium RIFOXYD12_FULL_60_8]|nr:MAG: acyl-CoA thioesterase [Alphaproteobacteria bacterium RIFOXYD12_FULL_60_8]
MNKPQGPQGRLSLRTVAMPADTNPMGDIFGGWLLGQMDIAGGMHAAHRARGRIATVAVDSMAFHKPVFVGDELSCYTEVLRVGTTSVAVQVEAWVQRRDDHADNREIQVTQGRFTYVALDTSGQKRPLPKEE